MNFQDKDEDEKNSKIKEYIINNIQKKTTYIKSNESLSPIKKN